MKLLRAFVVVFLIPPNFGYAGEDLPCYPAEAPVPERTKIIWCQSGANGKDYFRVKFKPSPNQCKVADCERQRAAGKRKPVDSLYEKASLDECASSLTRPGCFMQ